ncbi:h-type lectin domain-containing protein [Rhizoctonia solani]|nr:h-type lectin domain-containing protein [Rhizoctonia solani]KAF8671521.1 Zinc-dependent metalloprotease [Rhizoctonia solani]KAF8671522.1 Zinc-dependent metalloprotease [Rhizoctonia solani]KAF8751084.1 Zinc-dependent metalloprotease [Rhizoctonia solani]QRW21050.1 h-type lectin domain-containing protein [Rhizoctonia solani]
MANHGALFNTMDVRDWTKPQLENSKEFTNNWPATNFPLGINWLDYDRSSNIRLKSYIDNVKFDEKNLTFSSKCHLDAWYDSKMYSAGCTWLGHFNDRDFQSGYVDTKPTQEYTTVDVTFKHEYASTPNITCWFTAIDLDKDKDWRIDVSASDVTKKGCKIKFRVWGSTHAYWLKACWIAHPSDRSHIDSGSFNTMDQRPWDKPQHEHQKSVAFSKKFGRPPLVYCALSRIDETNKGNLRLKTYIKDVSPQGMKCHIDSWHDTVMYSAVCQWIAYQKY